MRSGCWLPLAAVSCLLAACWLRLELRPGPAAVLLLSGCSAAERCAPCLLPAVWWSRNGTCSFRPGTSTWNTDAPGAPGTAPAGPGAAGEKKEDLSAGRTVPPPYSIKTEESVHTTGGLVWCVCAASAFLWLRLWSWPCGFAAWLCGWVTPVAMGFWPALPCAAALSCRLPSLPCLHASVPLSCRLLPLPCCQMPPHFHAFVPRPARTSPQPVCFDL